MSIAQIVTRGFGPGASIGGIVTAGFIPSTSDTVPDAFSFVAVIGATISTLYTSNTITITGIDVAVPYSVTGGLVSINGGAFSSSPGTAVSGDTFALQLTSSSVGSTLSSAALTVGGVTGTYSVTTAADTSTTYNWTLTRERICDRALMKCGVLAAGESADADDRALSIEGLESVLKNLLWRGYRWPKSISSSLPVTLIAATPNTPLPIDFYNLHALNYLDANGKEQPIRIIDFPTYKAISDKLAPSAYPCVGYIDNFNVLWTHPVQIADVTARLYYQKVVADTAAVSSTDLDSPWMLGIIYAVCCEIGDEFGVDAQKMQRFEAKWSEQRELGVRNEVPPTPDRVLMDD